MTLPLVCPHDMHSLSETATELLCVECGRQFPVKDGVICTLDTLNDFYEGTYEHEMQFIPRSERPWHAWPLWLVNSGYLWNVRRYVPPGSTVIELGCAGGVRYFGRRYRMVGCDFSLQSLNKASSYERRIQADLSLRIPMAKGSVDAVVSSYFWEHISPEVKPHLLSEVRRVLRPGGVLVFLYDVETQNPLIRRYKEKAPQLYKRLFIDGDGHWGYQRPAENMKMFEGAGFRVVKHQGMEKSWILSASVYSKLIQFDMFGKTMLKYAIHLGEKPLFYCYSGLMRIVDTMVCPWLPESWARVDLVVCEKRAE